MTDQGPRTLRLSEVKRLRASRQPRPLEPFPIDLHELPDGSDMKRGQGHTRWAEDGTRWCPYCQTILGGRRRMCAACRPRRRAALESIRTRTRRVAAPDVETLVLTDLLDAIDTLARLAPERLADGVHGEDVILNGLEDVFMATKDVIVGAESLSEFGIVTQ